jgi:hypothetical protein
VPINKGLINYVDELVGAGTLFKAELATFTTSPYHGKLLNAAEVKEAAWNAVVKDSVEKWGEL